jgi:hypothetical protein
MRLRLLILGAVIGLVAGLAWPFVTSARAQLVRTTPPEQLRFRLVGTEPIASADGTNSRTGWYVSVFKDMRRSEQCYVAFSNGSDTSMIGPTVCP